jgi:endonuclease/exonuclease/phosphatase family metal-dependent hydrolase
MRTIEAAMSDEASILDTPPALVAEELDALRTAVDAAIPRKQLDHNLLIATWNLRMFSSLTRKWTAGDGDSPTRDLRGLLAIKTIIERFDVVALQEVMGDLRALRDLMRALGRHWGFLMTDVNLGSAGNAERMAFVYDRRRVQPSGLAAELVVPPEWQQQVAPGALTRQFARTPYAVGLRSESQTFILVTLHVRYGEDAAQRQPELATIARFMAEWAERSQRWHHNLLVLGDFNIDRKHDALWQAFTASGLSVPEALDAVPRSIFADPAAPTTHRFYDQIAWFGAGKRRRLEMDYLRAGSFDFLPWVYRELALSRSALSFRISDHYPLWAEFRL